MKSFKQLAEEARQTPAYFVQGAILDFTEDVVSRMKCQDMTKSQLAAKIHTSPAFVTKLLSGENNFTLETMVKIALAVDAELRIHLHPKGSVCHWIDVLKSPTEEDDHSTLAHSDFWTNAINGDRLVTSGETAQMDFASLESRVKGLNHEELAVAA